SSADAVTSRKVISSAPAASYRLASSTGSPASRRLAKFTPFTTRPAATSRQGITRTATATHPAYRRRAGRPGGAGTEVSAHEREAAAGRTNGPAAVGGSVRVGLNSARPGRDQRGARDRVRDDVEAGVARRHRVRNAHIVGVERVHGKDVAVVAVAGR